MTTAQGTVLKGHSVREVESHWSREGTRSSFFSVLRKEMKTEAQQEAVWVGRCESLGADTGGHFSLRCLGKESYTVLCLPS